MGRQNTIQSWVKHDDDHPNLLPETDDAYTGEQVKPRHKPGKHTRPGYLANGMADIASCDDPRERIKADPSYSVHPALKTLGEYDAKLAALDEALRENRITLRTYKLSVLALDVKLDKAHKAIKKLQEYVFEDDEQAEQEAQLVTVIYPEDELESATVSLAMQVAAISRYENEEF